MENENMMICEEEVMEPEFEVIEAEVEETTEGNNTALAMLIGAGLMAATTAAIKLGKKLWVKYKTKKELRQPDEEEPVEVTDEQIEEIVTK